MHSPSTTTQRQLAQSASPYFHIALYAAGNVFAVAILLLVWFSWGILAAFQEPLLWAWLCSLSLRDVKRFLVSTARKELLSSSFIVCCAKLVFLPAVIAWQLFEEVRDKLQAKYHELQVNSSSSNTQQAGNQEHEAAAAAAAAMAATAAHAADAAVNGQQDHHSAARGAAAMLNGHAPEAAAAVEGGKASQAQKRNAQVLRQRKASGKQQQQQQQQQQSKHQRPPLGPRSNSAAAPAGPAPQHRQGVHAAAAACRPKLAATGRPAAAASGAGTGGKAAGAGSVSPLQQRLGWLQDFFRQLFSGYGFITMELLRFVLGGLLPRRASLEQAPTAGPGRQQQQQQQRRQQQHQQPWPPAGGNSTLSALASVQGSQLLAAGLPPYLDLQVSGSSHRPSAADSLTDSSYPGSCRSECNMPWTPHPHLQQLYLQQQLQQQQQQQQQGLASQQFQQQHQHQQQPSRQNRLSSSSSSPSLHTAATAASRQPSPDAPGSIGVVDTGLERHATVPAAAEAGNYSLSGWSALQQQQQQQQQQGHALSRSDSTASCVTSQAVASSAAAGSISPGSQVPDSMQGAFSSAPFLQQQQHQQQYGIAAGPSVPLPAAGAAYSLPSPLATPLAGTLLPAYAASLGGPLGYGPPQGQAGGLYDGSGSCWEGLGAGRSPPGSTAGGTGAGSSSPSAVLFKGLLRGIVLYEGYRFVRGFLAAEESLFMPLLLLGATLAIAGGLPFLLLPASLLHTSSGQARRLQGSADSPTAAAAAAAAAEDAAEAAAGAKATAARAGPSRTRRMRSPFSDAASGDVSGSKAAAAAAGGCGGWVARLCGSVQEPCGAVGTRLVSVLVKTDEALRNACASSFLDTAVSGLIVVGLILGSVVLSAVLLVQIGDESRQAVVSVNMLVRQKGTEAGLTEGVWSLVQQYEGQLVGMTQYVLQETLPGLTHYVESRASDFLVSHNLSKVLIDWEVVRAALKLPADCGEEAKLRLAVQLANSSLAEAQLGEQRQALQQQLDTQQRRLGLLAAGLEALWMNGSSSSSSSRQGGAAAAGNNATNSSALSQELLLVRADVERLHDSLHAAVAGHEAANEQLKLAELRMHNCQPTGTSSAAAAAAAGLADAAQGRGLLSNLLGGFTATKGAAGASGADGQAGAVGIGGSSQARHHHQGLVANPLSHMRGVLSAVARFDFTAAGAQVTAMLGQLMPEEGEEQQAAEDSQQEQQQQQRLWQGLDSGDEGLHAEDESCGLTTGAGGSLQGAEQQRPFRPLEQCPSNNSCSAEQGSFSSSRGFNATSSSSAVALTGAKQGGAKSGGGSGSGSGSGSNGAGSGSSSTSTSLVRVARGAAYPLITMLRHVSSVVVAGLGSTTAVALGTGLGVLRLGLGVAKFLVQLGVFASVLYTLLALDIDPVQQLVKLLPISEASQDRASRAVTKALRGVFVSSLKLAAFHAGFTWLTLRAFGTHFVCTATVASAIVAVLPLVPVYLTALPAVLELVLVRGAAVKGVVLLALHVGAYTFGDDLIFREIEPTLPYLVGLGVFGGMYNFANPLQGVLLGPMVLALLSVGYNLHREMVY